MEINNFRTPCNIILFCLFDKYFPKFSLLISIIMKGLKMKKQFIFLGLTLAFILFGCNNKNNGAETKLPEGVHKITVIEHMNAAGYTYIKADDNGKQYWIAVKETPVENGNVFYFSKAIEMKNFTRKTLNKTFDSILFVDSISKNPNAEAAPSTPQILGSPHQTTPPVATGSLSVEPLKDGNTIAGIYKNKASLKGKVIKLRGVVTKFNSNIMNRNWIHVQDGSSFGGHSDITVTTNQSAAVGKTIVVEGTLVIDKDFGAGYRYDAIIENAKITVEKKS